MVLGEEPLPEMELLERIDRPVLESRLSAATAARLTVLVGPAGSGKSDLIRECLGGTETIYFRVGNDNRRFARFVHGFAKAIAPVAPGAQAAFPRAWERSLQSRSPSAMLAHWLCEHLDGTDRAIAIDDLHDAALDISVASFIAKISELRPNANLTIAVRNVGALPIALWMATRQMRPPIDERDLSLDRAEVAEFAERLGVQCEAETTDKVLDATKGLPVAVAYALTRLRHDPRAFSTTGLPRTFKHIAATIFACRTEREKEFLLNAALLPRIDDDALRLLGWPDPGQTRTAMRNDAAFMWERNGPDKIVFHDRFRDYLEQEFQARDMAFRSTTAHQAMNSLTSMGSHAAALEVATREPLIKAVAELLDSHGFSILESGQIDIISDALEAVEESSLGATGLALRGYIEARSGRLDTAEAWFRLGLDKARDEASCVTVALYYARELGLRRREDACEVLKAFATSTSLPRPVLIDVLSSFGRALIVAKRVEEARSHTDEALALLDADSPPPLRARVFARAATVALWSGQPNIARGRALAAVPLAVAHSLYEVAASAYSTLYNIAYDIDDDVVSTIEYLRNQGEMGVKSGDVRIDLFVMIAMYELHAEAGDEPALAAVSRQLATVDKHDATMQITEGLVPGKALQAAWAGHFDDAQRLLRPTAEHQVTAARRALRWAQIGLYCSAAGDTERAQAAWRAAENHLERLESHEMQTTQFGLTLLVLALGSLVSNKIEQAHQWMNCANDAVIGQARRLCALRAAIGALIAGCDDPHCLARGVPGTLAALRAESFGGMAKLIEALPYPFTNQGCARTTIANVLADSELSARFAAAVVDQDTSSLRAWLDTAHSSIFTDMSISRRFEQWAADHSSFASSAAQAGIPSVRRALATYGRPAPAIIGLIDNIDASIDVLFEDLAVASPLMAEHSRAVSAWCSRLARTIGLSESEIAFVTRCGLIHDIGKIWTPAEILDAPRKLTPDEWTIMRAHTTEGSFMVARVPLLSPFVPIVRGHHERLDGKGYPDGLPAKDIPLTARIVSVADCFNAMIGRRPYRPTMAPTEALNELERHRGTQFDPEIVAAMVQVVLGRLVEPALEVVDAVVGSRNAQLQP